MIQRILCFLGRHGGTWELMERHVVPRKPERGECWCQYRRQCPHCLIYEHKMVRVL